MRIKILMLGADPRTLIAESQLLKEHGFLVMTAMDPQNINELVNEVRSDIVFFDPHNKDRTLEEVFNNFITDTRFTNIPAILTISDDEYLVTGIRTENDNRAKISGNIIDAIKTALQEPVLPKRNSAAIDRKKTTLNRQQAKLFA